MGAALQQTVGGVELADEGMHPVDVHPQFNESALITLFDLDARSGGFLRIGNRPNEGHAEATFCWFLADGTALFSFERAAITDNLSFRTDKIRVDVNDPGRHVTATFQGRAHHLADPGLLSNPKAAFGTSPQLDVDFAVDLRGAGPLYGGRPFPGLDVGGHYEQSMCGRGRMRVDGRASTLTLRGNRDHSWGPRVWQATYADRTIWCTFDETFAFATSLTWHTPTPDCYDVIGYVWRDGCIKRIVGASIRSEYEDPARLLHTRFNLTLTLEDGTSIEVAGRRLALAPLRHRRDTLTTHIGWAMAEFVCGDRVGLGLSEYLDLAQPA